VAIPQMDAHSNQKNELSKVASANKG